MRLYRTSAGLFAGTQAEAGADASRIVMPDDKAGIIDFLNALVTTPRADDAEPIAVTRSAPPPVQPAPTPSDRAVTLTDVEAFIQAADPYALRSLFENVVFRGRELIKGTAA